MGNRKNRRQRPHSHIATTKRCVVASCGLTSRCAPAGVSFHTFPKATLAWVRANCQTQFSQSTDLSKAHICSRHYDRSFINVSRVPPFRRILAANAIPTMFTGRESPTLIDIDNPDSPEAVDAISSEGVILIPPVLTKPTSPIISENESSSENEYELADDSLTQQMPLEWRSKRERGVFTLTIEPSETAADHDATVENLQQETFIHQTALPNKKNVSVQTDHLIIPGGVSHLSQLLASIQTQWENVLIASEQLDGMIPSKLKCALESFGKSLNDLRVRDDVQSVGCDMFEEPQIEIYPERVVVRRQQQNSLNESGQNSLTHLGTVGVEREYEFLDDAERISPSSSQIVSTQMRDGIPHRVHPLMYDFSSSDDDSGGLVMGGEVRDSMDTSLPSILSFNNYQNRQNKKKDSKDRAGRSAESPTNNLSNPAKPGMNIKGPTGGSPRSSKSTKSPKNAKNAPSKTSKSVKPPMGTSIEFDEQQNSARGNSKSPTKMLKSPKKIKAEPKGGLKLRLSIGGTTPSIEAGGSMDISSIIDFVASGGGGDNAPGGSDEDPQFLEQLHRSKQKKTRPPIAKTQMLAGSDLGQLKKAKKRKPPLLPDGRHVAQTATTARAAALADEVIASVAAEIEVEHSFSEDEDCDPSMADPHRLTMVIPGEHEDDDGMPRSPQNEQDAIQGMLSMSGTFPFAGSVGAAEGDPRRSRTAGNIERLKARLAAKRGLIPGGQTRGGLMGQQQEEEDEFEKALRNCRQDDDFIYLGIDANDDEWRSMKRRNRGGGGGGRTGSGATDQTWNPKGVSLKGLNREAQRPQREGVKREIMESTLAESTKYDPTATPNTDSKTAKVAKAKVPPREKKEHPKIKPEKESITKISSESKIRRPGKKGMATAKQRLGKILKIHKMYH